MRKVIFNLIILSSLLVGLLIPGKTVQPAQAMTIESGAANTLSSPTIDGIIDASYGAPVAVDPSGDGNGNLNMDLLDLYLTDDEDFFYIAFRINADIAATNWGKYLLYIDTTYDTLGAPYDAWGRSVAVNDPHKPEFSINSWVDATPYDTNDIQFWAWNQNASSWSNSGSIQAGAIGTGTSSVIEWQIAKSVLGNPDTIWVEVWSTGGGTTDNAQDTINEPPDDWNANDWATLAVLDCSSEYTQTTQAGAGQDNDVWWADLGHNSRDTLYRVPQGPVTTGTPVILRFRSAQNDLTAVKVRVWNDRINAQTYYDLNLTASDGTYDWWEISLPASSDATVYWYRFIAIDGTDTDYYEDDEARTGGWGQVYDESADNSWQLTIYDPEFQTPDWVKNAIIYQIFPDRFRDGDVTNDTPAGTFFYNENETIYRSNSSEWNHVVCDPRDTDGTCSQIWSQNFYGGDLQGVIDKLDYLEALGVTAIYFNPIFESPSNHKYDTTDYSQIDDNLGDLASFEILASLANDRGIHLILDGVFNHTSSDSIYFDRYARYGSLGACESPDSLYRDWYTFQDVPPGSGPCTSSDGTPNAATYTSWFGYDSLPKLNSSNPNLRQLIWDDGESSIAPYWVLAGRADGWRLDVAGDVDPGSLTDPNNNYWEGFRTAVREVNPESYINGEEWGYGSSWLLGEEWDAVMNYQFSSAVLSFWRDEPFIDNDHNPGSSAGTLTPLSPSQLDERLKNLQERYPAQALYAMMNLLGSHDTNRALFMLDHRTDENNDELYQNADYDWSEAITLLKGVVILQMTLPGAPTIYYGDEIGLVGPVTYDEVYAKWEDDPYNRQPYPWLDESGTPFYAHLRTPAGQSQLGDHYTLLAQTRTSHPALRTGSFDTLLVDDPLKIYAYGRKLVSSQDAAIVVLNRDSFAQDVELNVFGYLPTGAVLLDVLNGNAQYVVQSDGSLTINSVPAMFGAVLVLVDGDLNPPHTPSNLSAMAGESQVFLNWETASGAVNYNLYRSLVSGGGYVLIATTAEATYNDTDVINGQNYYYVVRALGSTGLESSSSNEATALPHYIIDDAHLQWPTEITHIIGLIPTENIYGQILIEGVTNLPGAVPGLIAQIGIGPIGTDPAAWVWWEDTTFHVDLPEGWEEWNGNLLPEFIGDYDFVYRFSTTGGLEWVYADLDGIFTGIPPNPGSLHVVPSEDTTVPETPQNLAVIDWSDDFLSLGWHPISDDPTLYAYDLFRSEISGTLGTMIARIISPTTLYTDTSVTSGVAYYYSVQAIDTSFNRSDYSNQAYGVAEPKLVDLTINVTVPDFTPGTVYIVGDQAELGNWNPGAIPMTQAGENTWTFTQSFLDQQSIQFKFTRGNWETVEKGADGNEELPNRVLTVDYGIDGQQNVDLVVANWRDPIVVGHSPSTGVTGVALDTLISVNWSQSMTSESDFSMTSPAGLVEGQFAYDEPSLTVTFTPNQPLSPATIYEVIVEDQIDVASDSQQVPASWLFQTIGDPPTIQLSSMNYQVDEGAGEVTITVTLSAATLDTVSVDIYSSDGTAGGGQDYSSISDTFVFAPQQMQLSFVIPILDDSIDEVDETFQIYLSDPQYADLGEIYFTTITIGDNDPPKKYITTLPVILKH